jgi:hypothetical protein
VLVADLDTGYDAANPDLKGVVAGTKDFTGSPHGVQDLFGHGTWTASIIAGSGAGSGGRYRGVAPGARLLVGKVLGNDGSGTDSQVIAGMEWAVAQHARVVNMSLGALPARPGFCLLGTGPVSQAVDSLSAGGTLFVVSAGNNGQFGAETINEPGVASGALTAGAVDSAGRLAFFSSTGPRCSDDAVKPDVTAPGVGVVGARAAGTALGQGDGIPGDGPVNVYYTRASGTSASAPYTSGAAAVLAQEHPVGLQLKAALMDSATPASGTGVFAQGDGQVSLARAVAQHSSATPSVSDVLPWPHTSPVAITVVYHNNETAALPLSIAVAMTGPDGRPAPAGMFRVRAARVTVPAGGSLKAAVTVNAAAGPTGLYGGWLAATGPDGTLLHTALGVEDQPQLEKVTIKAIDRRGTDISSREDFGIVVISVATGQQQQVDISPAGDLSLAVPPGRYDFFGSVPTAAAGSSPGSSTLVDHPVVDVTRDLTVTFDARQGVPVTATIDRRLGDVNTSAGIAETVAGTPYVLIGALSGFGSPGVYAVPTPRVTGRPYGFLAQVQLDNGPPDPSQPGRATVTYSLEFPSSGRIPGKLSFRVHDASLAKVRQTFRQQGKPMGFVDLIHYAESPVEALFAGGGSEFFSPAGGTITEYLTPGRWQTIGYDFYGTAVNPAWAEEGPAEVYQAGHAYTGTWGSAALGAASATTRLRDVIAPDILPDSASAPRHLDADQTTDGLSGTIILRRGATVIGTGSIISQPTFRVPAATARYTLSATMRRSVPWSTLGTAAQATWTFRSGHVAGQNPAVLPLWDVRISGAFDSLDRAPAGRPFRLMVAPDVQPGAPRARITSIAVRASFDDGRTWHRLVLRRDGPGRWTTTVTPPRGAAFVSLSASLTDAAGNNTQQTVIRAYQL